MIHLNKKLVVSDIDKEGKLYTNVSRAYLNDSEIILDYHSLLLRITKGDVLLLSLYEENNGDLDCDYQMNGMVYKIEEKEGKVEIWISFGGLLMIQKMNKDEIGSIKDRSRVVLCVSKV
ncbi:DNA-directed RNA polymerase I [Nosema bombycis CQ1]|nr:DNA-directed RNA polymerase I [Nosema bombycis CQ1]|eukprot:EOB14171.1 DNA-directed RNA polymerase I [Nosema bombycis CQ1]